jgi:hypothetical protein
METEATVREPDDEGTAPREWMENVARRALEMVRQRPGAALLVALGAGFLIGRVVRSWLRVPPSGRAPPSSPKGGLISTPRRCTLPHLAAPGRRQMETEERILA